jgi:cyclopropane fatty-acyl-phospholipid synthase-like methyltransferase
MTRRTKDPVNQPNIHFNEERGHISLGILKSREWIEDPRRMLFSMSRYKFVSKILSGRKRVLEVGCGDGFNAPLVMQEIEQLTISDFCAEFVNDARARMTPEWPYEAVVHNFLDGSLDATFDAAYSLDVLEHIDAKDEDTFIGNICKCLTNEAAFIVGMPSLESQDYASEGSKLGHINCKTSPDLKALMEKYFNSVFMFSMNDETIHTGYHKMAHYIFALCAHPKAE